MVCYSLPKTQFFFSGFEDSKMVNDAEHIGRPCEIITEESLKKIRKSLQEILNQIRGDGTRYT